MQHFHKSSDLGTIIAEIKEQVAKQAQKHLVHHNFPEQTRLLDAMQHTLLNNGKMLRPIMLCLASKIFSADITSSIPFALAIEMIHAYTLIHDDLPALDNDDYRRGSPSCHKKFDEATAILAGNSLLTYAFQILSRSNPFLSPNQQLLIINQTSKYVGYQGTIGGQMLDLIDLKREKNLEEIERLNKLKTGNLFVLCTKIACIIHSSSQQESDHLMQYSTNFGIAYQMKDNIEDNEKTKSLISLDDVIHESLKSLDFFGNRAILLKEFTEHCFAKRH